MQNNTLNRQRQHLSLLFLSYVLAIPAKGDTLLLRNGDRISGKILSFDNHTFRVQTDYAGDISVNSDAVHSFSTDHTEYWQRELTKRAVQIHPAEQSGYVLIDNQPVAFSELTLSQPQPTWRRTGTLDTSLEVNNDEKRKQKLHINAELGLESKHWRHRIKSEIKHDKEDKRQTEDNGELGYTLDYFMDSHWLVRSDNFYRNNKLQDNSQYTQIGAGPGYRFWGEGKNQLDAIITYNRFWLTSNRLDLGFSAWAATINYKHFWFDEKLETFSDLQIAYPDIELIDHISNSTLGARYRLTRHIHFSVKYDYNETQTTLGSNNDYSYTLGAGLSF